MNMLRRITVALAMVLGLAGLCSTGPTATSAYAAPATSQFALPVPVHTAAPAVAQVQAVNPDDLYHKAWQAARDNFLWQGRLNDWHKWEKAFAGQLNSVADAESAIHQMLGSLSDPYTFYRTAAQTAARAARTDAKNVVSYKMLPGDIGYIRISTFSSKHCADETQAALVALKGAKGYILDLRDNGGGYVHQAFKVFALFVDKGVFTTMKGQYQGKAYTEVLEVKDKTLDDTANGATTSWNRTHTNLTGGKPLVVLVNGDSASASEMLSGALRDAGRATIVGTTTFGKGIAQITVDLPGAASVQVTFAEYFLPAGKSIHGKGIRPGVYVSRSGSGDNQLTEAVQVVQKDLSP